MPPGSCEEKVGKTMHVLVAVVALLCPILLAAAPLENHKEDHLQKRIESFYRAFEKQEFDTALGMYSEKARSTVIPSQSERERLKVEWGLFVEQNHPIFTIKSITIEGARAIIKMDASIQLPNGNREFTELFDLWIFENGDWYFRTGDRTNPRFLPKD
jgi:hypothetical protein